VPLSTQVLAILDEAKQLKPKGRFVFPSVRSKHKPMSEYTINPALRRLGYGVDDMTGQGFRTAARTLLVASGQWSAEAIDEAFAQGRGRGPGPASPGDSHWAERVRMAQWWSDHLEALREGAARENRGSA
jgi:hypothetical protein